MGNKIQSPSLHMEIDTYPVSDRFKDDWKRIFNAQSVNSPFSTLEWIEAGIDIYVTDPETIYPLRFVDSGGLTRAICILRKVIFRESRSARRWPIHELRSVDFNSQRTIPVLAENSEYLGEAVEALLSTNKIRFDICDLFKVDVQENEAFEELSIPCNTYCARRFCVYDLQPRFLFSGDWESYLMARTQGHRKKIRRYTRKLQESYPDYCFTRLRTADQIAEYGAEKCLEEIHALFSKSWQAKELKGKREDSLTLYREFYTRVFTSFYPPGQIDLALLHADGRLLAFDMSLNIEGHIYMLYGAYDPEYQERSPGTANLVEILRTGFEQQDAVLEFGGGFLEYKRIWANDEKKSYQVSIARNTLRGRLTALLWKVGGQNT